MNSGRERVQRRLAAILAADVAGYSRLMGEDEEGTHAALTAIRREVTDPKIKEHRGRIVKSTGDGLLVEFASIVDAVRCAVLIQREMAARNAETPGERRIEFRVGINLGDIIGDQQDIYGDGVNVAVRLEGLGAPGGICVSRVVRDQVRDKLDLALEDMGEQQVKNIVRPLRVFRILLGARDTARGLHPSPSKPSLAVLPFENLTGEVEQDYFVDGVVEEITTAISRLPWLFVIARNSSFAYKGRAVDVRQVARELGVRYVLEGSVRKSARRVRITSQLIDTTTGAHIWADRFDGALDDILALQDQVASAVVGAIEPQLRLSEIKRVARKRVDNIDAYDLYLRALAQLHRYSREGIEAAAHLLQRALAIDPSYAPAGAMFGFCRALQTGFGRDSVSEAEIAEALDLTRRAIEGSKDDPDVLWMAGDALSILSREHSTAAVLIERALALNPNSAHAWMAKGWVACCRNQPRLAIDSFLRAIRLSPRDPLGQWFSGGLALAHLATTEYHQALEWADLCSREHPRFSLALRIKVVCYVQLGLINDARNWAGRLLELVPDSTISRFKERTDGYYPHPLVELFVDSLRKADLPEG